MTQWDDVAKAAWILEYGMPDVGWIFERVGEIVYQRPMAKDGQILPPWISTKREVVLTTGSNGKYKRVKDTVK